MINVREVARVLGGVKVLHRRLLTLDDLREAVEEGLPVESLDRTVAHVAGDRPSATEIKHGIVTRTTLQRRGKRLSPEESERLERLARLTALAEEVWEDPELAREFLTSPQPQLGGKRPVELARTDLGARQVETILLRLEHSLPV